MENSLRFGKTGKTRRLRAVGLVAIVALTCAGAGGFLFVAISGWPDVPGLAAADAQPVERERTNASPVRTGSTDAAASTPNPVNSIARQADAWNVKTCLPQIKRISDFLTSGHSYTALSQRIQRSAGEGAFAATIAARDQSGLDSISTLVSVPVNGDACHSAYQTVAAFPEGCERVQSAHFSTFAERLAFGDHVQAWHNGQGSYVYFLPLADAGCIIVKTQMFD